MSDTQDPGGPVEHHSDGSVTLTASEVGDLRKIFASVLAGDRIQASLSEGSVEEYRAFVALHRSLGK